MLLGRLADTGYIFKRIMALLAIFAVACLMLADPNQLRQMVQNETECGDKDLSVSARDETEAVDSATVYPVLMLYISTIP